MSPPRFFGLVILPVISFSSDGIIAIRKFSVVQGKNFISAFIAPPPDGESRPAKTPINHRRPQEVNKTVEDEYFDGRIIPGAAIRLKPTLMSHGRPIDLSIQFTLLWMPVLVLLGWWTDRPMHLLFGRSRCRCSDLVNVHRLL